MLIDIFNKNIELREHYCQYFDNKASLIDRQYINLYIRFKGCNANCKFCTYMDAAHNFDFKKYEEVLKELTSKLHIRKIGFTGGEPTLQYDLFKSVLGYSFNQLGRDTEYAVNSNGINFKRSSGNRHHYDDKKNNEILGFNALSTEEIKELQKDITDPNFLQLSCNLIKGYIDNDNDIKKYMEFANNINVHQIGFVTLMDINKYSKDNYVNNDMSIFNDLHKTKQWENKGFCKCSNYIYVPEQINKHCVKLYTKNTFNISNINNTLTFNGKNLVYGFDDNNIIY